MKRECGFNNSFFRAVRLKKAFAQSQESKIPERFRHLGRISELGKGAVSTVWRIQGEKDYALKEICCSGQPKLRRQAQHEIDIMKRLTGVPGAVQLLDYEEEKSGAVYLLEPYVKPFSEWIREKDFTAEAAVRAAIDICEALEACAGQGILHLDVQPKNLFVEPSGRVILGDFGVSLFEEEAKELREPRGTLAYMAPEVYREGCLSQQADIYSLGIVLFGLFNDMILPFMEDEESDTAIYKRLAGTKLPEPLWFIRIGKCYDELMDVLNKMCAFRPEDRYPDARTCREALEGVLPEVLRPEHFSSAEAYLRARRDWEEPLFCGTLRTDEADELAASTVLDVDGDELIGKAAGAGRDVFPFDADRLAETVPLVQDTERGRPEPWGEVLPKECPSFDADVLATSTVLWDDGDEPIVKAAGAGRDVFPFDADRLATTAAISDDGNEAYPQGICPPDFPEPVGSPQPEEGKVLAAPECRVCGQRLQPGAIFCPLCGTRIKPMKAPVAISRVQFSAVAPKKLIKGEYSMINIMMYEPAFRHVVDELIRDADGPVSERKSGVIQARMGARVMIHLTSPDLTIEDGEEEYEWVGEYLEFDFAVMLPEDYHKRQVLFCADVYIDGCIATHLKFTALCSSLREQKMEIRREDVLSAFISYASKDRKQVLPIIQGMQKARPDMDIFFDVETLRSGEDWEKTLYSEIERRDILYLCWSCHARESVWVNREWEYAYQTKGAEGIEPIPIEPPEVCPPPPAKLSSKHFNDRLLYLMKALDSISKEEEPQAPSAGQSE